jgi:hypothetical protein
MPENSEHELPTAPDEGGKTEAEVRDPGAPAETAVDPQAFAPPPAGFETLVTMLFTQAMAALGQFPGPEGQVGEVNKPLAKYFIDTVDLLGEKTQGNLSEAESQILAQSLHAMRMAYVSTKAK